MSQQPRYFRYTPQSAVEGFSPLVGDVVPGRVYEVRPEHVSRFVDSTEWEKATKSDFDAQD